MSILKTRLIREKNILLEKRYIFEQSTGDTQSTGTTNITTTTTTQQTSEKITKQDYDSLPPCSTQKNPTDAVSMKTEFGFVLKSPSGKKPYCKDTKKK